MSQLVQDTHNLSDNIQKRIAKLIKFAREKQNLSQDYIANESGLSVKTIKRAEKGDDLVIDTLLRICSTLGLSFDLLFFNVYNTSNISDILILLEKIVATELANYNFHSERNRTIALFFHVNREFSVLLDDINFQNRTSFGSIKELPLSLLVESKKLLYLFFNDLIKRFLSMNISKIQENNVTLGCHAIDISQEKFSELADVSLDTTKRYINGQMLKLSSLSKIASIHNSCPTYIQTTSEIEKFFTLAIIGEFILQNCA